MKKIFILQTAVFICLWGCADDESGYSGQIENIDETIYENVEPADPYSLESMQAAFDAMSETRASVEYMFEPDSPKKEFVVYATHHQVKFTVTSMEQWEKLESDDELCLLGMPISRLNSLTDEEIAAKLKEDAEEDEELRVEVLNQG